MARMIGYFANQTDRIRCALTLEAPTLRFGADHVDGWGVGSLQSGEVLLRKKPTEARDAVTLLDLVRDLHTGCAIAHVRTATVGPRTIDNTHPFRLHQWIFAATGTLPRFAEVRAELLSLIPQHIAHNIRGDTDSEVIFHLALAAIYRMGHLDDADTPPKVIVAALDEAVTAVERVCGTGTDVDLMITHGRAMVAFDQGKPMAWLRRQGIRDCAVCRKEPETAGREPRRVDHEALRYVILAGDVTEPTQGWHEVKPSPRGTFLAVDRNLDVQVTPR